YSGKAFAIAGTSTIFASIVFHCALKTADPSAVIRSTTCTGTSEGGICGSGGSAGAAAGGAGAWAHDIVALIAEAAASPKHPKFLCRFLLRIFPSPCSSAQFTLFALERMLVFDAHVRSIPDSDRKLRWCRHRRLLGMRRERPSRHAAQQRDERATFR